MKIKNEAVLNKTIERCKERNIIIPTFKQMINPELVPEKIREELKSIGLWDLNPRNLFRITWKNEPVTNGGGFNGVNYLELPSELTGVKARIFILIGKYFPTGAHKVGATFGPLVSRLITGDFDPTSQKAVWPSTGNYCRGGAYNSYLLGCESIAILPEEMSQERFDWLNKVGAEIFATPGCESNVKEIYDKTHELTAERGDHVVILNQFAEFSNPLWHYHVTGRAMEEVFLKEKRGNNRLTASFLTQGSAGTLAATEYLRSKYPTIKVGAGEALQCPTLLYNGYGGHRIEGIGDKHIPWIMNMKNVDMVGGIDDEPNIRIMRLFNEPAGHEVLKANGVSPELISHLHHFGISSIANVMGLIKMAKYYEMNSDDCLITVATDSMEMYQSRMKEENEKNGAYTAMNAQVDYEGRLMGIATDHLIETTYLDKKRMHNLKYFTWIEQQGKDVDEINAQWYDEHYWENEYSIADEMDEQIMEFNEKTGILKKYL